MAEGRPDRLWTISETAEYLSVSERSLRTWIKQRRIEVVRLSGCIRLTTKEIDSLIQRSTMPARWKL